jgi:hypothetical protein
MNKARTMPLYQKLLIGLIAVVMAVAVFRMFVSFRSLEPGAGPPPGKVWSEEHQHNGDCPTAVPLNKGCPG